MDTSLHSRSSVARGTVHHTSLELRDIGRVALDGDQERARVFALAAEEVGAVAGPEVQDHVDVPFPARKRRHDLATEVELSIDHVCLA